MKVFIGMSGGVDSSVTAALLKEQGYQVQGVFIEAYNEPGCRTDEDRRDALRVAKHLGIPFEVLDLKKEYEETVVKYFFEEYAAGRTPNPDILCNSEVKFGLFLRWAIEQGVDKVATGHYGRISREGLLQRARDLSKDQSYFLWQVEPEKLAKVLFPLGKLLKSKVREKARELKLPNAEKPDSMGVCMMGQLSVRELLRSKLGEKPGEVVWKDRVVGEHRGLWFATIGQRIGTSEIEYRTAELKKMGVDTTRMPILYLVEKNVEKNQLIVGEREEVMQSEIRLDKVSHYGEWEGELYLRVRNLGILYPVAKIEGRGTGVEIVTEEPVFAPAAGQSAVLYRGGEKVGEEVVVGGGLIV